VQLGVAEQHGAAFARGHQLAVLEAEGGHRAQLAHLLAPPLRAVRVCGVLQQRHARIGGELRQRVHVGHQPRHVHRHDGAGLRRDRGGRGGHVDVVRARVDVDRHGHRPEALSGLGGGDERERRDDDLAAGRHAQHLERELQRVRAVGDRQCVPGVVVVGELLLETVDLTPADPPPLALVQRAVQPDPLFVAVLGPGREFKLLAHFTHGFPPLPSPNKKCGQNHAHQTSATVPIEFEDDQSPGLPLTSP
jgi:hypothetical protein